MLTNVRDTSLSAYDNLKASGKKPSQEAIIVAYLRSHYPRRFTRNELARGTGLTLNAVCGRVNTLIKDRIINDDAKVICSVTGKKVHAVSLAPGR